MTELREITFRYGIPQYLKDHIKKLFEGHQRKQGKHIVIEHYLTDSDRITVKRIIEKTPPSNWEKLAKILPDTIEQLRVFDAAWVAAIDYNHFVTEREREGKH